MPTYRNIGKGYYVNTKYNIFNIAPDETFQIDKEIDSPFLEKVDDNPPALYEGDMFLTLNAGDTASVDIRNYIEVSVIPDPNNADNDFVYLSVNTPCNLLSEDEKHNLDKTTYFHEPCTNLKGYNTLYFEAPSTNTAPFKVRIVYRYR